MTDGRDAAGYDPHAIYSARLAARRLAEANAERRHRALGNARLVTALVFLALVWPAGVTAAIPALWLVPPVALFVVLAIVHEPVLTQRRHARRAAAHNLAGLARLEERWHGQGEDGLRFQAVAHPYAIDLDLFGPGSLFQLLCRARTRMGEETLAAWLLSPAAAETARARQIAVCELASALDLREELALAGEEASAGLRPAALGRWVAAPALGLAPALRGTIGALTLAAPLAAAGWLALGWTGVPLLAVLAAQGLLRLGWQTRLRERCLAIEEAAADLGILAAVLARLERERFQSEELTRLRQRLNTAGRPASARIRRLRLLADCLEARRNLLFAPLAHLLLWDFHFVAAAERWRESIGAAVLDWLAAVGEFEALASLAGYAWERPEEPFPELAASGPLFEGEGIGHPLLPRDDCVRNDLRLDARGSLLVISGSNMSGKSTLLRTVGTLTVMALAGGPTRARRLRVSELQVAASLRAQDSLLDGVSRFGAELRRLKQAMDLTAGARPVLFLADEIMLGTNSADRRVGVEAVVRGLLARGSVGLVTTHDLALAEIADELAPRAANVHFADDLLAGRMVFDFRLRPGPVPRGNALGLMRMLGLEVPWPALVPATPTQPQESR